MMKKSVGILCVALAAAMAAVPVYALTVLTGDSFSKTSQQSWVTDRYDPAGWESTGGMLELTVNGKDSVANRPEDKKDAYYSLQGKKLPLEKPTTNTWTVAIKLNVDENWFGSGGKHRAEVRVDLVDSQGTPLEHSPAIALEQNSSFSPQWKFYNPRVKTTWGTATTYVDGDGSRVDMDIEEGWHTLLIKANNGFLTYYADGRKLGNCTIPETDVYPSAVALGATNYGTEYTVTFDSLYLYDGSYTIRQLTSSQQSSREENLESKYESKRESWYKRYREYEVSSGVWKTENQVSLTQSQKDTLPSRIKKDKEMPDSYWDY